jgi:hypothetical protein
MFLVHCHHQSSSTVLPFKCAILFSPISVYDFVAYAERGEEKVLKGMVEGEYAIDIPVAIFYGKQDERKEESEGLISVCDPQQLAVLIHRGGHEIPGMGIKDDLVEVVKVARRLIYKTELCSE